MPPAPKLLLSHTAAQGSSGLAQVRVGRLFTAETNGGEQMRLIGVLDANVPSSSQPGLNPHGPGDLPLSARENGSLVATKLLSQPLPHHLVLSSHHPKTGECPVARSAPACWGAPASWAWPLPARKVPARVWKVGQELTPWAFKIDICAEKPPATCSSPPAALAWHCCTELMDEDVEFSWVSFFF